MEAWPKAFFWSKIGTEAGLSLDQILRWKDLQRQLTDGVFFWGLGQVPQRERAQTFLKQVPEPKVLFCQQLSRPKQQDANPTTTVLWTHYIGPGGRDAELPPYAAVTSKGTPGKRRHAALVCRRREPIRLSDKIDFDPGLFRNFAGAQIGDSQISALIEPDANGMARRLYRVGFWAELVSPYFAILTMPRTLNDLEAKTINAAMTEEMPIEAFKQLIRKLKGAIATRSV
jgi:hypothetical protein